MPEKLLLKFGGDKLQGFIERIRLAVLQRQHDHRVLTLMLIEILPLPDTLAVEQRAEHVTIRLLEEVSQHRKVQRLAEATRTGQQRDLATILQKLTDKVGLIHIIKTFIYQFLVIADADRYSSRFHKYHYFEL